MQKIQEMWFRALSWEDLEEGIATHNSIYAWRSHRQRSLEDYVHKVTNSRTQWKQLSVNAHVQYSNCKGTFWYLNQVSFLPILARFKAKILTVLTMFSMIYSSFLYLFDFIPYFSSFLPRCSVVSNSWVNSWTTACRAPLFMEFPKQEYWSGLLFPSPGDLPYPGIKPSSPALAGRFFTAEPPGKPELTIHDSFI